MLRDLFADELMYGGIADLLRLWNDFKHSICDLPHRLERFPMPEGATREHYLDYGLWLIFKIVMEECGKAWESSGFIRPTFDWSVSWHDGGHIDLEIPNVQPDMLNRDQRDYLDSIASAVVEGARSRLFFCS